MGLLILIDVEIVTPDAIVQGNIYLYNDSNGQAVKYDPPDAWNANDFCPHEPCFASPDPNKLQSGTWHESTFFPRGGLFFNQTLSATANFRGSAVYVYAVLAPSFDLGALSPTADITFYIDDGLVGRFSHPSPSAYVYEVLVYANASLPLDLHIISVVNGERNMTRSLFILDRIVYSAAPDDPQNIPSISNHPASSRSHSLSPGAIVGATLGSMASIIMILFAVFYCRRRRQAMYDHLIPLPVIFLPGPGGHRDGTSSYPNSGWLVTSDSKRDVLRAARPPVYSE